MPPVEFKRVALFNHVNLPEARQSIVNQLFLSISVCWNSCSCPTASLVFVGVLGVRKERGLAVTLSPLQDFQRGPDRKRELDPGSSSQTQGDEKMEIPEVVQAGSEQNNSPWTGKEEPVVKQMFLDMRIDMFLDIQAVLYSCSNDWQWL